MEEEIFAKSPDRFSFLIENAKKRLKENPDDDNLKKSIIFYEKCREENGIKKEKRNDLENDLRSCSWIIKKCKESKVYSQNLYAALCNNEFKKIGLLESFIDNNWHVSWRGAGGIIANLREEGDYIDFYSSGIGDGDEGYLPEGKISDQIAEDLKKLGWQRVN